MAQYTRVTTLDTSPGGDTVKQGCVDLDEDLTGIVGAYNVHDVATTGIHGIGAGTVCGTTLTQTLTNKTLTSPTISSPTLTGTVAASGATISSPTITAGTIQGASTLNALTFAAATTGWTGAGGTTSKTLTVTADTSLDEAVAMSSKAPKASPTFTGTVTNPFTVLGTGSPVMKLKRLNGTSANAEGGSVNIAHGLTLAKIIGFMAILQASATDSMPPNFTTVAGYFYDVYATTSNIAVRNHATESENILSKPVIVTVMYEE